MLLRVIFMLSSSIAGVGRLERRGVHPFSAVHYYNNVRPHRALDGRAPLQAYSARLKARPQTHVTATYTEQRPSDASNAAPPGARRALGPRQEDEIVSFSAPGKEVQYALTSVT
jgi:hypothetical protein